MEKQKLLQLLHEIEKPANFLDFQQVDTFRNKLVKLLGAMIESIKD